MKKEEKIQFTELDRERWRFILYQSKDDELYGDFSYQPTSFVDTSMLIKLNKFECHQIQTNRDELVKLSEQIRNYYSEFKERSLDKKKFNLINNIKDYNTD